MTYEEYFHKCDCGTIIHVRDTFTKDTGPDARMKRWVYGCENCRTELPSKRNHPTLAEVEELPTWNYSVGSDTYPVQFVRRVSKTRLELARIDPHTNETYKDENGNAKTVIVSRRKNYTWKPIGYSGSGVFWPHTESLYDRDPHF
ncbi:MAG: hypothetical protein GWN13_14415 [Phycisphaerae bacterium]|nr:hypothetical protein [Phycisphaerae bacterium]NIW99409.1 hypothetical protein [Phycisphaerae bacterium]